MIIYMQLNDPWFDLVKSGKKLYEGRRNWHKTKNIKIGDWIRFSHYTKEDEDTYIVKVTSINYFKDFREALQILPIYDVLPLDNITIEDGVEIYKKYVSEETQRKDGIIMFGIKYYTNEQYYKAMRKIDLKDDKETDLRVQRACKETLIIFCIALILTLIDPRLGIGILNTARAIA